MIADRRAHGGSRRDVLSMLIGSADEAGASGLSDREVRDEALTLLLAGHETTANALMWTWYLLSHAPDVRARLHEEVDRVLAGRSATVADVESLPYVLSVVTESMRLFPPVWTIGRRAKVLTELGGYPVPAGANRMKS